MLALINTLSSLSSAIRSIHVSGRCCCPPTGGYVYASCWRSRSCLVPSAGARRGRGRRGGGHFRHGARLAVRALGQSCGRVHAFRVRNPVGCGGAALAERGRLRGGQGCARAAGGDQRTSLRAKEQPRLPPRGRGRADGPPGSLRRPAQPAGRRGARRALPRRSRTARPAERRRVVPRRHRGGARGGQARVRLHPRATCPALALGLGRDGGGLRGGLQRGRGVVCACRPGQPRAGAALLRLPARCSVHRRRHRGAGPNHTTPCEQLNQHAPPNRCCTWRRRRCRLCLRRRQPPGSSSEWTCTRSSPWRSWGAML